MEISEEGIKIISNLMDIPVKDIQKALQSGQRYEGEFDDYRIEEVMPFYHEAAPDSPKEIEVIRRIIAIAIEGK